MKALRPLIRRYRKLPAPLSRSESSIDWVAMNDGTRLETRVTQPVDLAAPLSCILLRSEQPPSPAWGPFFAEQGHVVVQQQCRGRRGSEGRFEPFLREGDDGADTVDWIEQQPWYAGRLGVAGFGYAAYTAWATLSRRPESVHAVAAGLGARDPYQGLYQGGALQLEWALHLSTQMSDDPTGRDLARGVRTRPVIEADRVALRRMPWYREWLEHPTHDAYWEARTPMLPEAPPPCLLLAGLHHPTLAAQLADHALLSKAGTAAELVIGPWGASPLPRRERSRQSDLVAVASRRLIDFFGRTRTPAGEPTSRVQVFLPPTRRWHEPATWPPPVEEKTLYLHPDVEDGRLSAEPPAVGAPGAQFVYDPADARPTLRGASVETPGSALPVDADWRGDALRYRSAPLESDLDLLGPARLSLSVSSDARATDFTARLMESEARGGFHLLGEGITRVRDLQPGTSLTLEIEFPALARRLGAGSRLCLEVSSASFPRFDRHPNIAPDASRTLAHSTADDGRVAHQTLHHDAEHPSRLTLGTPQAHAGTR